MGVQFIHGPLDARDIVTLEICLQVDQCLKHVVSPRIIPENVFPVPSYGDIDGSGDLDAEGRIIARVSDLGGGGIVVKGKGLRVRIVPGKDIAPPHLGICEGHNLP